MHLSKLSSHSTRLRRLFSLKKMKKNNIKQFKHEGDTKKYESFRQIRAHYSNNIFLISQPKHMLWILKRKMKKLFIWTNVSQRIHEMQSDIKHDKLAMYAGVCN